jgi:hypothetical protein
MARTKPTTDRTAKARVANMEQRRRDAGLVAVSLKVWVPAGAESEAREIMQKAKRQIEKKWPRE